jgi:hypothetical protein
VSGIRSIDKRDANATDFAVPFLGGTATALLCRRRPTWNSHVGRVSLDWPGCGRCRKAKPHSFLDPVRFQLSRGNFLIESLRDGTGVTAIHTPHLSAALAGSSIFRLSAAVMPS